MTGIEEARLEAAKAEAERQWAVSLAYKQTFGTLQAQDVVLPSLEAFCCGSRTTITDNWRDTFVLEGRRQVWLMIHEQLGVTREQLEEANGLGRNP